MRDLRRLPPLMRMAAILGLLLSVAALALLGLGMIEGLPFRVFAVALNVGMLGGACNWVTLAHNTRFHGSARWTLRLDSWQSQVRALGVLAALPLVSLVLAVLIPSTRLAVTTAMPISVLAAGALVVAYMWISDARQAVS